MANGKWYKWQMDDGFLPPTNLPLMDDVCVGHWIVPNKRQPKHPKNKKQRKEQKKKTITENDCDCVVITSRNAH